MQKREYLYLIPLVIVTCLVFSNSLTGEFLYDDKPYITKNPQVIDDVPLADVFTQSTPPDQPQLGLYRPFFVLTLRMNYLWSGLRPSAFHGTNLILHIAVTMLLFLLIRRLTSNPAGAFLGALIFAVHPAHVEAVTWIVGRAELLSCFFCLLAALVHFGVRIRPLALALEGLFYSAALLSKENALAFPMALWVLEYGYGPKGRPGSILLNVLKRYGIYLVLIAGLFWVRFEVLGRLSPAIDTAPFKDVDPWGRIEAALAGLAEYIRLLVFPHPLKIFYHISELRDLTAPRMIVLIAALGLPVATIRKRSPIAAWMLFMPIMLIPVLNLVPIGAVFAERFFYLPSVGGCAALGLALGALLSRERNSRGSHRALWIPTAVVIGFSIMTYARNPAFDSTQTLWKDAVRKGENFAFPHYNLGECYFDQQIFEFQSPEVQGAVRELKESLRLNPDHPYAFSAHFRLGQYYQMKYSQTAREPKWLEQAVHHYEEALRLAPPYPEARQKPALLLAQIPCVEGAFNVMSREGAFHYLRLAEKSGMDADAIAKVDHALHALIRSLEERKSEAEEDEG